MSTDFIETIIFGSMSFDSVGGCTCHKDLIPIVRRYAFLAAENDVRFLTCTDLQIYVRQFEIEFFKLMSLEPDDFQRVL